MSEALCQCGHAKEMHHRWQDDPINCYALIRGDGDLPCGCRRFTPPPTRELIGLLTNEAEAAWQAYPYSEPDGPAVHIAHAGFIAGFCAARLADPPPTVPRLARSVDDLRVGMVVAIHNEWDHAVYRIESVQGSRFGAYCLHPKDTDEKGRQNLYDFLMGTKDDGPGYITGLVILSDPPARDWLVPATQMEALREAVNYAHVSQHVFLIDAARAVLDAAREVEHE